MRCNLSAARRAVVLAALATLSACDGGSDWRASYDGMQDDLTHELQAHRALAATIEQGTAAASVPALGPVLTADGVAEQAAARDPALLAALRTWQAAADRVPQVTALDDPRLSVGDCYPCIQTRAGATGVQASLSQAFPWPGKLSARGEQAYAQAEQARQDYRARRLAAERDARRAFYALYRIGRDRDVVLDEQKLLAAALSMAKGRYAAGGGAQADLVEAETRLAATDNELAALEAERRGAQAGLDALLDLAPDTPLPPLPAALDPANLLPPDADYERTADTQRPEVARALDQAAAGRARERSAHLDYYPDITAMLQFTQILNDGVPGFPADGRDVIMAQLSIGLPWLQLGKRRAAVGEGVAMADAGKDEARSAALVAEAGVASARAAVAAGVEEAERYRKTVLPLAQQQVESAEGGYAAGRNDFPALLDAIDAELDAERRLADQTAAAGLGRADLLYAAGLDAPPAPASRPAQPKAVRP